MPQPGGRLDALRLERTKHGRIPHSRVVLCDICLAALGMNDYADVEDFAAGANVAASRCACKELPHCF